MPALPNPAVTLPTLLPDASATLRGYADAVLGEPTAALLRSVDVSDVLGAAAVTVGLLAAWPQVLRMRRTRNTAGVSWPSAVLGVVCVTVWLTYGVVARDTVQMVNNMLALLAATALCAMLLAYARPRVWPALTVAAGAAAAVCAAWVGAGAVGVAAAASTLSIAKMLPQLRLVLSSAPLLGLCPWSTLLGLLAAVLWLGYGLAVTDVAVTVTSFVAAGLSTVVTARRLPPRRTLQSLANGRLGSGVARAIGPLADLAVR